MLKRRPFTRLEIVLLCVTAALLLAAGGADLYFSVSEIRWRLGLASVGILILAAPYLLAARRGRPL